MKKIILTFLLLLSLVRAADYSNMSNIRHMRNVDLRVTDYGTGLGGYFQWNILENMHAGIKLNWTFVSSGKEYTVTDPYGYTYKMNAIHLDFARTGLFVKYHIFSERLANSFSPFVSLQVGPVLSIDTDNDPYAGFSRYFDESRVVTWGVFTNLYVGLDFMMEKHSSLTVAAGHENNRFPRPIDEDMEKNVWGGASLILQFGRYF